jgi:hypothetical protein
MEVLIYTGGIIITLWGAGHLVPTKGIIAGFGQLSKDNRLIITMEWLAEGFTLIFIGVLSLIVVSVAAPGDKLATSVCLALAAMLAALSGLSFFTGFKTSIVPIKACPFVKLMVAAPFILGAVT